MSESPFDLSREVEDLFRAKMREFMTFCEQHWKMTERDAAEANRSPDWVEGWDAAIEGLPGALDCWLEEYPV